VSENNIFRNTKDSFIFELLFEIGEKIINSWVICRKDNSHHVLLLNSDYYFYKLNLETKKIAKVDLGFTLKNENYEISQYLNEDMVVFYNNEEVNIIDRESLQFCVK